MKPLRLALLLSAFLVSAQGLAQAPRTEGMRKNLGQSERNAVELRQGMTPEQVQALLGKPRRTALRAEGAYSGSTAGGTLQWTYVWGGGAGSSDRILTVDFAAKSAGEWAVNGWVWPSF